MGETPHVHLVPLTDAGAHDIEHWFDDPEVLVRLGGRPWIHRELQLISQRPGTEFRGARVLRSYGWIGVAESGAPVVFIGGDVYDRWVRYHGMGPSGPILTDADERPALGLAYLVDPAVRRHGYCHAAVTAILEHPDVADVEIFFCGIDADNEASRNCAVTSGLTLPDPVPDFEGMLYYRLDRSAAPEKSGT